MKNKYYVVMEIITDEDGLVSITPVKTTEIMPEVPEEDEDDN